MHTSFHLQATVPDIILSGTSFLKQASTFLHRRIRRLLNIIKNLTQLHQLHTCLLLIYS